MNQSLDHSVAARADYRFIRRNGAVVPFEPSRISNAMTRAFLAVAGGNSVSLSSASNGQATTASADGGSVTSAGIDGAAPGDAGGDDDSDGDGDGDGDGPRRRSRSRRKPVPTRAARRKSSSSNPKSDRAHRRATFAFTLITTLALGTVLACALNDQQNVAEKILLAFGSITGLAAALLHPK